MMPYDLAFQSSCSNHYFTLEDVNINSMKRERKQLSERMLSIPSFLKKGAKEIDVFDSLPTAVWILDFEKVLSVATIMKEELDMDFESLFKLTNYYLKLISLIQIEMVNQAAVKLYGATSKGELENQFLNVYVDFKSAEFKGFILNVLSEKQEGIYLGVQKKVNGNALDVHVNYRVDTNKNTTVFCTVTANEKARSVFSNVREREVKNQVREAGWIYNCSSKQLKMSEQVLELFNVKSEEGSGVSLILNRVRPEDKMRLIEHYALLFSFKKTATVDFVVVLSNGEEKKIVESYKIVKESNSNDFKTISATMKVLDLKKVEYRERDLSYEYLTSGSMVSFLWKATDGWPVEKVSENVTAILGYTVKDFVEDGLLYQDIIHKDDLEWMIAKENWIQSTGIETGLLKPYRIFSKSGEVKWVVGRYVAQKNEVGEVEYYNGFIEDVTKSKSLDIVFKKINSSTVGLTGQAYLNAVSKGIADVVGADFLTIGFRNQNEPDKIELVANYVEGSLEENFVYSDKGTPCKLVRSDNISIYKSGVAELFPMDTWLKNNKVEGYLGVRLKNNIGVTVGLIAILYKKPLQKVEFLVSVLELFTSRVAVEVQELKLKELLVKKEEEARTLFIDSPAAMWIEDYSEIKRFLKELKEKNIQDLKKYVQSESIDLLSLARRIKMVDVNDKCVELTKACSKVELMERYRETYTKSSIGSFLEILVSFYKGNYTYYGEMQVRNLNGAYKNVAVSVLVPPMSRDRFDRVIFSIVDITKSLKIVQSLAQNKLYLENYIDSIPLPSMMWDTEYRCVKWNKTASEMFGYSEEEMLGKGFKTLFFDKVKFEVRKNEWREEMNTYGRLQRTTSNATKLGKIISCNWNVMGVRNEKSKVIGYITLAENITERIKEERKKNAISIISKAAISDITLKEFYKRTHMELSKFLDAENCFIAIFNEETNVIHKDFMVSTKTSALIDLHIDDSLTGLVIKGEESLLLKTEEIKAIKEIHEIQTLEQEPKIWLGTPLIVRDKCIGAIVVKNFESDEVYHQKDVEDLELIANSISGVIERKRTAKKLKRALKKALQSESLKSSFLANMSHEIRTPMNGIVGFSELLSNNDLKEEDRKHYTKLIMDSSAQLLNIVNDILDISQIEAGMVRLKKEEFELHDLMNHLLELHQVKADAKGVKLLLDPFDKAKLSLESDKTKLLQVLSNLVSNAIKFTNGGSIRIGYSVKDEMLEFYVEDSGIGISKKFHSKIFNRFIQTNEKIRKQTKGNGLGLAICKSFVALFGGEIWIAKSDENGTKICFNLPYVAIEHQEKKAIKTTVTPCEEIKKDDITLLIAEDEVNNMVFLEEVFSRTNYTLLKVENGKEAVDLCAENGQIDVVLMDVKMPIMNGLDATEIIKKARPSLPIIALSAFAMESDIKYALSKGCDTYISKPINRKLLLKTIITYVSKSREK